MDELARKYNLMIIYHTDGVEFVPARSRDDVGIDVLIRSSGAAGHGEREPCGRIRRRIVFHALDNQQPAVGSAADVVDEVKQNLDIFRDDRWICAPCHRIRRDADRDIVAMYETIHELAGTEPAGRDGTAPGDGRMLRVERNSTDGSHRYSLFLHSVAGSPRALLRPVPQGKAVVVES